MNKKSINSLINKITDIEREIPIIRGYFNYIKSFSPKDYREAYDRDQVRQSVDATETEIIRLLLIINKRSEEIIKKIDKESWKEHRDGK